MTAMRTASAPMTSFNDTAKFTPPLPEEFAGKSIRRWTNHFIHRRIALRNNSDFVKSVRLQINLGQPIH
jgi:hypothetical protein